MIAATDKMIVKRIEWMNQDTDISIFCFVQNGIFGYQTKIILESKQLNKVITQMQKQHPEFDIQDCLKIEQWSEEEVNFIFELTDYSEIDFLFDRQFEDGALRQIRA